MYSQPFDISTDYDTMLAWLKARDAYLPPKNEVPEHGVVACLRGEAIAIGFIRSVEGGYGQIDGYVTNPTAPADLRDSALECLTPQLIEKAKELKLKGLMATTRDRNTLVRSLRHGFVQQDLAVITLDLSS